MARIAGVDLPREKRVEIGLTYIFGIGRAMRPRHQPWRKPEPRIRPETSNGEGRLARAGQAAHGRHDEGRERPWSERLVKASFTVRGEEPEGGKAQEGIEQVTV